MARVKIKTESTKEPNRKLKLKILSTNEIYVTRIITIADAFIVIKVQMQNWTRYSKAQQTKGLKEKASNP